MVSSFHANFNQFEILKIEIHLYHSTKNSDMYNSTKPCHVKLTTWAEFEIFGRLEKFFNAMFVKLTLTHATLSSLCTCYFWFSLKLFNFNFY